MPTDEVHADDVERVVVAELELQAARRSADRAGDEPDVDRRHRRRRSRARRDRDEPGDRARRGAERGGVPAAEPLDEQPAEHRGRRGHVRVDERLGGDARCRASAEPALNPNQPNHRMPVPSSVSGSDVRRHRVLRPAAPLAEHEHRGERRDAGVDVHDGAAGEVERAAPGTASPRARTPSARPACTRGSTQSPMNQTHAENCMRSAIAPVISAGVMIANISWNAEEQRAAGSSARTRSARPCATSCIHARSKLPMQVARARRTRASRATTAHRTLTMPEAEEVLHQHAEHVLRPDHAAVEQRQARAS